MARKPKRHKSHKKRNQPILKRYSAVSLEMKDIWNKVRGEKK